MSDLKSFIHDVLLEKEDICNLQRETKLLLNGVAKKNKLVVYGKRNSGKTSLVKNVIIPTFKNTHKKHFVIFCDFMEVKDMDSLVRRIRSAFEQAFVEAFPVESLVKNIKTLLTGLRPSMTVDPVTGEPALSIVLENESGAFSLETFFEKIEKKIAPEFHTLIVLDEFQDVSFIPEAQGLLRNSFQKLKAVPIIVMGSKKHILSKMFAVPDAPFADFGSDIEFFDIPYQEYYEYCIERLKPHNIKLSLEISTLWQDLLMRNPESMNILGGYLVDNFKKHTLTEKDIRFGIEELISLRRSRFEELISHLSSSEEEVLVAISKNGPTKEPSGKAFGKLVKVSHMTIIKAIRNLEDHSFIEKTPEGYNLINPLLKYYLMKNR